MMSQNMFDDLGPPGPVQNQMIGMPGPGPSPGPMPGPGQMPVSIPGPFPPPRSMGPQFGMPPGNKINGPGPGPGMNMMPGPPGPLGSGKIYPPNQPMVFNPSNPNAPPIYPCGGCHKEVHDNDQAILCESGCNFWFHRICTGLSDAAYQMLTSEVYAEWVCDKCLQTKQIPLVKMKP